MSSLQAERGKLDSEMAKLQEELHKIRLERAVEHLQRKELEQKKVNNFAFNVAREKAKEVVLEKVEAATEVVKEVVPEMAKQVVLKKVKVKIGVLDQVSGNTEADNNRTHQRKLGVIMQDLRRVKAEVG